jgi:hypothetical protein
VELCRLSPAPNGFLGGGHAIWPDGGQVESGAIRPPLEEIFANRRESLRPYYIILEPWCTKIETHGIDKETLPSLQRRLQISILVRPQVTVVRLPAGSGVSTKWWIGLLTFNTP